MDEKKKVISLEKLNEIFKEEIDNFKRQLNIYREDKDIIEEYGKEKTKGIDLGLQIGITDHLYNVMVKIYDEIMPEDSWYFRYNPDHDDKIAYIFDEIMGNKETNKENKTNM